MSEHIFQWADETGCALSIVALFYLIWRIANQNELLTRHLMKRKHEEDE